jgi:protein-disulfide isomerase
MAQELVASGAASATCRRRMALLQRGTEAAERLAAMNQRAVNEDGVQGTPTFLINGERVEGAVDWASLEPRLRAALRR